MSIWPPIAAFGVALVVTRTLVSIAPRLGLVDRPNERSLHQSPIATIGGVGLVAGVFASLALLEETRTAHLIAAGVVLMVLIRDEITPMGPVTKLVVQSVATGAVLWGGYLSMTTMVSWESRVLAFFVIGLAFVYTQNIFNFMDGLDGLSGLEGAFVAASLYALYDGVSPDLSALSLCICAASIGFVVWNLPPARIFMGDVGAHFLGLLFVWIAFVGVGHGVPFAVGILPLGAFLFDSTYTLIRRVLRRENITKAHRFHLYQRLHRSGSSAWTVNSVYVVWTLLFGATALALKSEIWVTVLIPVLAVFSVLLTIVTEIRWARTGDYA